MRFGESVLTILSFRAGFIGEESASFAGEQQIPRAIRLRFGMTTAK
jgi:hypothetical protein